MSKIGKRPIILPAGVSVAVEKGTVKVVGPKGALSWALPAGISLLAKENEIFLIAKRDSLKTRSQHGLARAMLASMVQGTSYGFEKKLKLVGVGFRAEPTGSGLRLTLGFSHPIEIVAPEGISLVVDKNIISISGIDKQLVGEVAARIRALKPPEPYKGKGIMYVEEQVRRKPGKAAKAAGPVVGTQG
jgi:large subunit ribosomal protein L6